jgi:quercetin dioxygenase-like cupin family protein
MLVPWLSLGLCAVPLMAAAADAGKAADVRELLAKDLAAAPGQEVRMLTVEYPPGASSRPHRHHAQVFVYVLEGHVRMQVRGAPEVVLAPGGTFYEGPDDVHTVSANASSTEPAKILVLMVKEKGAPVSQSADAGEAK